MRITVYGAVLIGLMVGSNAAVAQSPIFSGPYTAGHAVGQISDGVIGDAGPSLGSSTLGYKYLTEVGITNTGTPFCINDALINAAGGYHQLCLGANVLGGGLLSYNPNGGASALPFEMNINGSTIQFPFVIGGIVGPSTSIIGDLACWNNTVGTLLQDCGDLSGFAPLASPHFTGIPTAPTPVTNVNTTQIPTTAWVNAFYAPLLSPPLTGVPTAPTAAPGTSTTQLATTAFTQAAITAASPLIGTGSRSISTSDTALNADAHTTIYLIGAVANQTLTVSALGSYTDSKYSLQVCNSRSSGHRWLVNSADAGSLRLYPGQCNTLGSTGSALVYQKQFQRYYSAAPTVFVGPSGQCSSGNDGLTATTAGQLCSINAGLALLSTDFDSGGGNGTVKLADGSYTEDVFWAGQSTNIGDGVAIVGNLGSPTSVFVQPNPGGVAFGARDYGILFVTSLETACNGAGAAIQASQFSTIDVTSVFFGGCPGAVMNSAADGGHVDWDGGNILDGNATNAFGADGAGSQFEIESQTISCIGAINITFFVEATGLAQAKMPGLSFVGCGSVAGTRWLAGTNAIITTGSGNCNAYFPGSGNGSVVDSSAALCD